MYQIKNELDRTEILMYDEIGIGGITTAGVIKALQAQSGVLAKRIALRINSQGGDLFEALTFYNYMTSHNMNITVYIDGLCASAASIIAMTGRKIIMPENALMVIHNPSGYCEGEAEAMREYADTLDRMRESCAKIYMSRTGLGHDEIIGMMNAETHMNGSEAKEKGFADEVSGTVKNKTDEYARGVHEERERLKALDALMTPERAEIINEAKYGTFKSAGDIALKLLEVKPCRNEHYYDRRLDADNAAGVRNYSSRHEDEMIASGVRIMNQMRGYKNVG